MSRPVHADSALPGSVAAAWDLLSGPGWPAARARELGDDSRLVERAADESGAVRVVVSRALPDGAPGFLARFLPQDGRVVQTDSWEPDPGDGTRAGTWSLEIPGGPGELSGTMRLVPAGTGCRQVLDGTVRVSLPLVGGRAESFLADMVTKVMGKEAELLRGLLA